MRTVAVITAEDLEQLYTPSYENWRSFLPCVRTRDALVNEHKQPVIHLAIMLQYLPSTFRAEQCFYMLSTQPNSSPIRVICAKAPYGFVVNSDTTNGFSIYRRIKTVLDKVDVNKAYQRVHAVAEASQNASTGQLELRRVVIVDYSHRSQAQWANMPHVQAQRPTV